MSERNMSSNTEIITVSVLPDRPVIFEFAANEAQFGRSGNDLNITLEGGPQIITEGYFVADANGNLPPLQFSDSEPVAGEEFLAQVNPEMDLAPASGEMRGGGLNAYNDASGDLIGGLELSGDLGSFAFSSAGGKAEAFSGGLASNDSAPGATVAQPVAPAPNVPTNLPYDARAVLYSIDNPNPQNLNSEKQAYTIRFAAPNGTQSFSSSEGYIANFTQKTIDGVNYYEATVSADGKDAMQQAAQANPPTNVYDYVTITLADGSTKVVQIVINQTGEYSTAAEDIANPHGQNQDIPEWHIQSNTGYTVNRILGDANDEMWLEKNIDTRNSLSGNVINLGEGDNTLTVDVSVFATYNDSTITSGSGDDTISTLVVQADHNAKNIINTGQGNDQITINGALQSFTGGSTLVQAVDGTVNLEENLKAVNTNEDDDAQSNTVIAKDINLNNNIGEGVLVYGANSVNTLTASNDITINVENQPGGGTGVGIFAQGNIGIGNYNTVNEETSNILTAGKDVNISVKGTTGATGIWAEHSGQVSVNAKTIDIDVEATGNNTRANGITSFVSRDSVRATGITLEGEEVNISTSGKSTYGMHAWHNQPGSHDVYNTILAKGSSFDSSSGQVTSFGDTGLTVNIKGSASSVDGIEAMHAVGNGASNNIIGSSKADTVNLDAYMGAQKSGVNRIMTGDGNDTITVNKITLSNNQTLNGNMQALSGGKNIIDAGDGNNSVSVSMLRAGADGNDQQSASNVIKAGSGNDAVNVTWAGSDSMYAIGASNQNLIDAGDGNNTINVDRRVQSNAGGANIIQTGTGDDTINLKGWVTQKDAGSSTKVDAGDGNNSITVGGQVQSTSGASFEVTGGAQQDNITFKDIVTSSGAGSTATINAGNGNNTIVFEKHILSMGKAVTTVSSGSGDDTVNIAGVQASEGRVVIDTGTGNDSVKIDGGKYGVVSFNDGVTEITSSNVEISATVAQSSLSGAFGSYSGGTSVIQAVGSEVHANNSTLVTAFGQTHAITVVITTLPGSAVNALAMHAGDNAVNHIVGSTLDDNISITGKISVAENFSGPTGKNIISTGDGDDTITLNGRVEPGALNIYAGEDNDILVLVADSLQQFNDYYQEWLLDISNNGDFAGMSIENIDIQINDSSINMSDIAWLTSDVNGVFANSGATITVNVDNLNINGYDDGDVTVAELAAIVDGFETIDMTGGTGTKLTVDGLLDGLGNLATLDANDITVTQGSAVSADDLAAGKVLMVTGDDNDEVSLSTGWDDTAVGSVTYNNVTYDVYASNDATATDQYVLIQQNILMN